MLLLWTLGAVVAFVWAPPAIFAAAGAPPPQRCLGLRWVAVALFFVAWFLPNPDLAGTDSFTRHAVGGGAASAVFAHFLSTNLGVRSVPSRIAVAYAVAACLGVATELAELTAGELFDVEQTGDSAWDLLANTVGVLAVAVVLELATSRARPGGRRRGRGGRR